MTVERLKQAEEAEQEERHGFLPLGSVVLLRGSVKKLLIVSRASIVEDDFFDYGAFLYPEGMIDSNIAYFNQSDIHRVVFEGYADDDNELALEILNNAYLRFRQQGEQGSAASDSMPMAVESRPVSGDDPFASVRDLMDDDDA
ncbi:hypothetical protein ASF88_03730 [Leifsonia sp. Leaf336]|uniref:DUF4176 domain-containing protein n=1 Tax=Leifsonia sp. Leaf336 TaxID=1736341 RepID=UPI0006FAD1A1|nr:DUF4176 domain-containing protein [Leifsonia sp. Leaf336]KQR53961.1 hypothetical protein ASF88_03730 [Leifsonia sp. Leaf336]